MGRVVPHGPKKYCERMGESVFILLEVPNASVGGNEGKPFPGLAGPSVGGGFPLEAPSLPLSGPPGARSRERRGREGRGRRSPLTLQHLRGARDSVPLGPWSLDGRCWKPTPGGEHEGSSL